MCRRVRIMVATGFFVVAMFSLAAYSAASVTVGGLTYAIQKVYVTSSYGPEFMSEKASGEFIVVRLTILNIGKTPADISASDFNLRRGDIKYDASSASMFSNDNFFLTKLNPGVSRTGTIVFDVPASTSPSKYQLVVFGNGSSESKAISL